MKQLFASTAFRWIIVASVAVAAGIPAAYFYNKYRSAQNIIQNPTEYARREVLDLREKVGKLIELPVDEEPTVATVTDADRLREQPFFASAQNSDRVLIFTQARKAILYRPSTNKIIEVAPINIGNNTAATGSATTSTQTGSGQVPTGTKAPFPTARP